MDWLRRKTLVAAVLWTLVVLAAAEGWFWARGRQQARRALAVLVQKKQERAQLERQTPVLSEENERAIARDLDNTRNVLAVLRSSLQGREGGAAETPPGRPVDLYFDLAGFVEKTRALAAHAQVKLRPDERFGFASHASGGPAPELVPAVFRQRVVVQFLVEALIEARPQALLAVQRERPLTSVARARRNLSSLPDPAQVAPAAGGVALDFFEFDPALSVRVPGLVDSDAFRLEFTGQTNELRNFLNALATFELPLMVRSVEVEPLAGEESSSVPATPPAAGSPVPLVPGNFSRIGVIVECLRLVPAAGNPSP